MVPRAPVTPAPAVTSDSAVTSSAGQLAAHWPLHALVVPVSFSKMYRDIPFAPVTYLPRVAFVATARVRPAAAVVGAGVAAAVVGAAVAVAVAAGGLVGET